MTVGGIISLVPSITETLLDWDVPVAACTRFCEQPGLAHVGGTKDPDLDAICDFRPKLVVMDREENRREHADELRRRGVDVYATHVTGLSSLQHELDSLARAVGVPPRVVELPALLPTWALAVTMIWRRPWMALGPGTYGSDVLAHIGIANVLAAGSDRYPVLDELPADADLLVLATEPYPFTDRHVARAGVELGRAVDTVLLDGQDLLWWGSRTAAALQRLAGVTASRRAAR